MRKRNGRFFAALLVTLGGTGAIAATVPQLNIVGFSQCLSSVYSPGPLSSLREFTRKYAFGPGDGLLLYLAVYPGKYVPFYSEALQKPWLKRWSGDYEQREERLAESLRRLAQAGRIFPQDLFQAALGDCDGDLFCSALLAHNVLRTLGRHPQAIYHEPKKAKVDDRNPAWFRNQREGWLQDLSGIQRQLISLLADGKGDRWGEWYHFFGLMAFGIHEAAVGKDPAAFDFAASLNRLLNPFLVGEKEEAGKAQLDRDSAAVVRAYLRWERNAEPFDCRSRAAYVRLTP